MDPKYVEISNLNAIETDDTSIIVGEIAVIDKQGKNIDIILRSV